MQEMIKSKLGLSTFDFEPEEGSEYGASSFRFKDRKIKFRVSKITPKKVGQFVTVWKRNNDGITAPFDSEDDIDFLVIYCEKENNQGLFVFTKKAAVENGIFSKKGVAGKRGMRVYPAWDKVLNKQAIKTQKWQLDHFIDISSSKFDKSKLDSIMSV
ncbi:MAG: hypothetical protein S4CHLAM20_11560 [Chlamydiia bacterium]|nr:hypothetical protein [Chlamydiia bacterium]